MKGFHNKIHKIKTALRYEGETIVEAVCPGPDRDKEIKRRR